jgi:hypothetical protein
LKRRGWLDLFIDLGLAIGLIVLLVALSLLTVASHLV